MNAKMPELKKCFESAGFTHVKTLLSSGNVVFDAQAAPEDVLEARIRQAMRRTLGREFLPVIRETAALSRLIDADPYAAIPMPAGAKRVVTFLHRLPERSPRLPVSLDEACIVSRRGREVLTWYVPGPGAPTFMRLIEKTFGTEITTRTWETIRKVAAA